MVRSGKAGKKVVEKAVTKETVEVGAKSATKEVVEKGAKEKTYQTYTKYNSKTGETYTGRTSGTESPLKNVEKRDRNHHMKAEDGWQPAELDVSSKNKDAIRGREQQMIDAHGGAKSDGGTSGISIRGVSEKNGKIDKYTEAAKKEFN